MSALFNKFFACVALCCLVIGWMPPAAMAAPTVSSLTPDSGIRSTTVNITLIGDGFTAATTIAITGSGVEIRNVAVLDSQTITADLAIADNATIGPHSVVVTDGGATASLIFSVFPPTPIVTAIMPSSGSQGSDVPVTLQGSNFVGGLTINAGDDISVRNLRIVNSESVTANLTIAIGAIADVRGITVSTAGGTSESIAFTVVPAPPPILSAIEPAALVPNTSARVTLRGANFFPGIAVDVITGITVTNVTFIDSTTAKATFTSDATAALGGRPVSVLTAAGVSNPVGFDVIDAPPSLTSIDPSYGMLGSTVSVALTGTNLTFDASIVPVSGITVTDFRVTNSSNATATFSIGSLSLLGQTQIRVTNSRGVSNDLTFTVNPLPPVISAIEPASAVSGTTVQIRLTGQNLFGGLAVDAGSGITVSNLTLVSAFDLTATLSIDLAAAPGPRNIVISTASGVSVVTFTVVPLPPTLTKIDPPAGIRGTLTQGFTVRLTGTNFYSPAISVDGTGVVATIVNAISPTAAVALLVVQGNAELGARGVTVSTAGGTSAPITFTVTPPTPEIDKITPPVGVRGTTTDVRLSGANFIAGATAIDTIPGITVRNMIVVDPTLLLATFTVASDANIGPHNLTVTTEFGTSPPKAFTVVDPFPDLSINSSHDGRFGTGFNETYTVVVSNAGTESTSGPITVRDTLPQGLTFITGTGPEWNCSAAGQVVDCLRQSVLAPNESSTLLLTVSVANISASTVNNVVSVMSIGDLDESNNSAIDATSVAPVPSPSFAFTPSPIVSGEQATVDVRLAVSFPHDLTGTLEIRFFSGAAVAGDDPAVQFATGGRTVAFTIPANQLHAVFPSAGLTGPLAFQTGTIAGTLLFNGVLRVGVLNRTFSTQGNPSAVTIPLQPPSITSIQTSTQDGFAVSILLKSPSREVSQLILEFDTKPKVKVSCGDTTGCTASDNTLTFDVAQFFRDWYTNDKTFGSLSVVRVPLNISGGTVKGKVTVTLANTQGLSKSQSFPLP